MFFGDMNRTVSQSSFYSTTRDETDVIILQNSAVSRWSTSIAPDDASSEGSSPPTPRAASRRSISESIVGPSEETPKTHECGDSVKLLPGSRPSSLYVPKGEKLSPARRSLSADAEPQVWKERERSRGDREGSDDESTPLVGTSPLSPTALTPTGVLSSPRASISRPLFHIDPADPETTL